NILFAESMNAGLGSVAASWSTIAAFGGPDGAPAPGRRNSPADAAPPAMSSEATAAISHQRSGTRLGRRPRRGRRVAREAAPPTGGAVRLMTVRAWWRGVVKSPVRFDAV